jgi:hypothetical protein
MTIAQDPNYSLSRVVGVRWGNDERLILFTHWRSAPRRGHLSTPTDSNYSDGFGQLLKYCLVLDRDGFDDLKVPFNAAEALTVLVQMCGKSCLSLVQL